MAFTNYALSSMGSTVTASSVINSNASAAPLNIIDGIRRFGAGQNGTQSGTKPASYIIDFRQPRSINKINVISIKDDYTSEIDPSASDIAYPANANQDFTLESSSDGATWTPIPNGTVTGNNLAIATVNFPAVTASYVRLTVTRTPSASIFVVELEAGIDTVAGDTTPPTVPTALAASSITLSGMTLSWNASTDAVGVTGYDLRRSTDNATWTVIPLGNVLTYNATGLLPSTLYNWQVRAHDAALNNSAYSASISATTASSTPPGVPPNLTVTPASSTALNINWGQSAPGASPAAGYKIRLTGGGNNGFVADAGNALTYPFGSLLPDTEYTVEVAAYDAAGNQSAWSLPAAARTPEYVPELFQSLYDGVKFLRARYYKYPSDWEKVQATHTYQDGGVSFNELNDTAPVKWEIGFTGMTRADADLFEAHFDYFRKSRPFDFTDKYGAVHRVYYADFDRSHDAHKSRIQNIKAVLIEYPSATNEKLTTDDGEFLTI